MASFSAKSGGCRHFALGAKWHGTLTSHRQCKDLHDLQVALKQAKAVCTTPVRAGLHQRLSPTHMSLGLSKTGICSAVWRLRSALSLPLSMVLPPTSSSFLVLLPQPAILESRKKKKNHSRAVFIEPYISTPTEAL